MIKIFVIYYFININFTFINQQQMPAKIGHKRPLTAYNRFVKAHKKPGVTMSQVALMWRRAKGTVSHIRR